MSEAVAVEVALPRELFCESMLPVREDLVLMVRERSFLPKKPPVHTGKIVIRQMMNDVETCEAICAALLMGMSARLIGKRYGLSPRSVANIRDAMQERGELAPVRIRIQAKLDRVIELGLERWEEGILDGTIHPGQLPIPTLAAIDKKGQLEAGVVPGTEITVGDAAEANIRAAWAAADLLKRSIDMKSVDGNAQAVDMQRCADALPFPDTVEDTGSGLPGAGGAAARAAVPGGGEGRETPGETGGGVTPNAPAPNDRGVGPENFRP